MNTTIKLEVIHTWLDDILEFWDLAHQEMLPAKTGNGGRSSERTIGLNVAALSFVAGTDVLGCLHEWEKLIRAERQLTAPALVTKQPTLRAEIAAAISFAQTHLQWSMEQDWASDYIAEIRDLHSQGMTAARQFVDKAWRLPCPTVDSEGQMCGQKLKVNKVDPLALFECRKCGNQWSTMRLIAVAMDSGVPIWLDTETIAHWYNISVRQVQRYAKQHSVPRKGKLLNASAFKDARAWLDN